MRDEIEIIDTIRKRFNTYPPEVVRQIGDDAAVVRHDNRYLLYTTDLMVEDVHFNLTFETPYQIGFRLVSSNVSDIFAMGGEPEFMLLNIALREDLPPLFLDELMDGIEECLKRYGSSLIGGDISESINNIFLSATLIGYSMNPILRNGARAGDRIYLTGTTGDSGAGLELLKIIRKPLDIKLNQINLTPEDNKTLRSFSADMDSILYLLKRHLLPEPRPLHNILKDINSMMDISDGLSLDLWKLCRESGVGATIYEERIPLSDALKAVSTATGFDALNLALTGGEDYELIFTTSKQIDTSIIPEIKITEIGIITEEGFYIEKMNGRMEPLTPQGYVHLRKQNG